MHFGQVIRYAMRYSTNNIKTSFPYQYCTTYIHTVIIVPYIFLAFYLLFTFKLYKRWHKHFKSIYKAQCNLPNIKGKPNANRDRSMYLENCSEGSTIFSYNFISFYLNLQRKICAKLYYDYPSLKKVAVINSQSTYTQYYVKLK